MDLKEAIHQLQGRGRGEGLLRRATDRLASDEAQGGRESVALRRMVQGYALLVAPAKLILQELVEGERLLSEGGAQSTLHRLRILVKNRR